MVEKLVLSLLIGWCCYQQVQLYNQELIQEELVKDILELKSNEELNADFIK